MNRLLLHYGAHPYTLADTDPDTLRGRILDAVTGKSAPFWLEVNDGAGLYRPTTILVSPASQIAISLVVDDSTTTHDADEPIGSDGAKEP